MADTYVAITGDQKTEFAGEFQMCWTDITHTAATGDVTISEYSKVKVLSSFIKVQATTATDVTCLEDPTTANKINFISLNESGGAATTYPVIRVVFLGIINNS